MRLDLRDSLRADAWALTQIKRYGRGKLVMYAWMSRGVVTPEDMAKWHFNGDQTQLAECMQSNKGALKQFAKLDDLLNQDYSEEAERMRRAEQGALAGETASAWAIVDLDDMTKQPMLLPAWFKTPICRSVLLWQKESEDWQQKIIQRRNNGKEGLPPKSQRNYEQWQESSCRRIVLDKSRESQVMNLKTKNLQQLKQSCLLLEIQMNEDPDLLRIRSGEGKFFKLVLLEGVEPLAEVPKELDLAPGEYFSFCVLWFG